MGYLLKITSLFTTFLPLNSYQLSATLTPLPFPFQGRLAGTGSCPEKRGFYPIGGQCDAYIECVDGVPQERLCPDGLLFNEDTGPHAYPCQYPIDVDCRARSSLQPAQPTERCPHQYAYYRSGDSRDCGKFVNCAAGIAYDFNCPEGLAWNKDTYKCDWPDQVPDCDVEAFLGFSCPQIAKSPELGDEETRFYRSNADCIHYFACVNGRPRMFRCADDQAYNVETNQCEDAANVTGCALPPDAQYRQQQPKLVTVQYRQQPKPTPTPAFSPFSQFRG